MNEPVYIEIITSPNCVHSPKALRIAQSAIKKFHDPVILREVSLSTPDGEHRAQEFEVEATPTIAINGRIAFVGVPTPGDMQQMIRQTIDQRRYRDSYFF